MLVEIFCFLHQNYNQNLKVFFGTNPYRHSRFHHPTQGQRAEIQRVTKESTIFLVTPTVLPIRYAETTVPIPIPTILCSIAKPESKVNITRDTSKRIRR